jgi:hypothetical protein
MAPELLILSAVAGNMDDGIERNAAGDISPIGAR